MGDIEIKKATLNDIEALQQIGVQTFSETFSVHNTADDMTNYLKESFSLNKLNAELSEAASQFYFATLNEEVIGYLKLNTGNLQTELQDNQAVEIERIYVLQTYHAKKIGQLLYDKAMQISQNTDADYVWLGVWEKKPRAISFYKKNGFVAFGKHNFKLGDDEQTDIMMKRKLKLVQ
ncbi:GNAT family N-acetyltransferase [Arcticibacter eurypsychrophilus]|uniref:GNAT family N-acetyltransferase n=1 Tax=Arcticibacter eurypsychrophilus TaxID=1434752 RepID=UPI00084D72E4|nr:GNAT family N-acetyltransferase [Arcticibacter eurypsychrophilus]